MDTIRKNINGLLDSQKKKLLERITRYIGNKLSTFNELKGVEIQKYLGIPSPRLSEIKDFDKYQTTISKKNLALCLGGGIVTINELIEKCAEDEKEIEYLKTLELFEDVPLQKMIKEVKAVGLNPLEILKTALNSTKK